MTSAHLIPHQTHHQPTPSATMSPQDHLSGQSRDRIVTAYGGFAGGRPTDGMKMVLGRKFYQREGFKTPVRSRSREAGYGRGYKQRSSSKERIDEGKEERPTKICELIKKLGRVDQDVALR